MEYNASAPIYLQVINDLKKRMVKGELKTRRKDAGEPGTGGHV